MSAEGRCGANDTHLPFLSKDVARPVVSRGFQFLSKFLIWFSRTPGAVIQGLRQYHNVQRFCG